MTTVEQDESAYQPATKRIDVSVGESVCILRELQDMTQDDLAQAIGMTVATLRAIEEDRVSLDIAQAKVLARALRCHPAVMVFSGWDLESESAA
jgi:DNA-binding XRE family transcriptional regulator